MTFLVTVTFVLGYGAGAALAPTHFGLMARAIGGSIALFNGILLVAFSLQYVRVFLLAPATEEALYDSYVVSFLLDQIGWVLLIVALIAWPVLLAILITGRRAYEPVEDLAGYEYGPVDELDYDDRQYFDEPAPVRAYDRSSAAASAETRVFPPRVPVSQQDESTYAYKTEPAGQPIRPTDATRPIHVRDQTSKDPPEPARSPDTSYEHGHTDPAMTTIPAQQAPEPEYTIPEPEEDDSPELAPGYSRCANCHAVLPPDVRVCPVCGEVN